MKRTKKTSRAMKALLYTDIRQEKKEMCSCPYCGGRMLIKPAAYIKSKYENQDYIVCENYPVCDSYARVKVNNGSYEMISTPANKRLRLLRKEAHFWIDKLIETGIATNYTVAYTMTSQRLSTTNGTRIHIGQCRELICEEVITACVNILSNNRNRFDKLDIWKNTNVTNDKVKKAMLSFT